MSNGDNSSDHQPAAGAAGHSENNNVRELSSFLRRTLLRCSHCNILIDHYHYVYAISLQSLPLWCFHCRSFNPQWEVLVTDFPYYRWNTDPSDLYYKLWENRGAAADSTRTEEIENSTGRRGNQLGGSDDQPGEFANYDWNMDDQLRWERWINVQLSEYQNNYPGRRREEEEEEEEEVGSNYGGRNNYREETIWKYLITRYCKKCCNKEGEICVICQKSSKKKRFSNGSIVDTTTITNA